MNLLSKIVITSALIAASATVASACNINARQLNQQHRIWAGVANGDVSFREFRHLQRGQANVRRLERFARWAGGIGPVECALLRNALDYQSARIFVKKH
jgi:hypothetical protein